MEQPNFKNTTQEIQNLINNNSFESSIKELTINCTKYNWALSIGDSSVGEIQERLLTIYNFLKNYNNLFIIDNYSQNKRNSILNNLTNIFSYLQNIKNGSNQLSQLLNQSEQTYDIMYSDITLDKNSLKFSQELSEVKKIKKEYINLLGEIDKLLSNKETISSFSKEINEIQSKLNNSEQSFQRIRELEGNIQNKTDEINTFGNKIQSFKETYEETKEGYENISKLNQEKTDNLIKENETLQSKVLEFLEKTIGGKSSEQFNIRADEIKFDIWIKWIFGTTLLAIIIGIIAFGGFKPYLNGIEVSGVAQWQLYIIKFFTLIPFILLDIFFYSQYNYFKKLKEEYKFKAIISGTLETFVQLLKDHDGWENHKDFIINTANIIFESPISKNKEINLKYLEKLGEKAIETSNKVIDKALDKV